MNKIIIILLILLIPQIYYLIKEIRYKSLNMTKKFFKRQTVKKMDFMRKSTLQIPMVLILL